MQVMRVGQPLYPAIGFVQTFRAVLKITVDFFIKSGYTVLSMNFWGFTPDYFAYSQEFFKTFLSDSKNMENLKSEFFIPLMVDKLINDGTATVEVLDTNSKWFGVTYPEDRQSVVDKIKALVDAGEYPAKLF